METHTRALLVVGSLLPWCSAFSFPSLGAAGPLGRGHALAAGRRRPVVAANEDRGLAARSDVVRAKEYLLRQPPSGSALAPSNSALPPSDSVMPPSNSALSPSGSALTPSGSALTPSGSALAPSDSALPPSNSAPSESPWASAALPFGAALVAGAVAVHAPAWSALFGELGAMKAAMLAPGGQGLEEYQAAVNFFTLFAVAHPLLTPVLWISEVLHLCPGPKLGGLVPVSFVALNAAVLWALGQSKPLSTIAAASTLALFLNSVGQGLASEGDLAGYNLALNGETPTVVRGCPAYEEVRQPSMAGFDVEKYQGRWYENAFHDWTQFTEVYDTTLDISLAPDKTKWLDDFGLKGPSPDPNPRSWDKSPVANGAHYFLYGKLDPANPNSGVLQETGFGVSFPNYIVDVQKNKDGEYEEAIQFQCLERGGVRVFEGINFLSRSPSLSSERLAAMHARAAAAGMDPYGSAPSQMHVVAHTDPATWQPVENEWQAFWNALGLPKLLALVEASTHSAFEDIETDRVQ